MIVRYISDTHFGVNGRYPFEIPVHDNEHEHILVIAGDICDNSVHGTEFIVDWCTRFKHVIYVFGNHEYYGQTISGARDAFEACLEDGIPDNLHILDAETFEIDNVMFIGATLWTDLDQEDPVSMVKISCFLNDCHQIRVNDDRGGRWNAEAWLQTHKDHLKYIEIECLRAREQGKTPIVITHHCPSLSGIHEVFSGSDINGGFTSDLDHFIERFEIPYWIHGHMHHVRDYEVHGTRILCNPRGYHAEDLQQADGVLFDPLKWLEL